MMARGKDVGHRQLTLARPTHPEQGDVARGESGGREGLADGRGGRVVVGRMSSGDSVGVYFLLLLQGTSTTALAGRPLRMSLVARWPAVCGTTVRLPSLRKTHASRSPLTSSPSLSPIMLEPPPRFS